MERKNDLGVEIQPNYYEKTQEIVHQNITRRILKKRDSELAHLAAVNLLHIAQQNAFFQKLLIVTGAYGGKRYFDDCLSVDFCGLHFDNPIIWGAGGSKNGKGMGSAYFLGFGSVVAGTSLEYSQPGNPRIGNPPCRQWVNENGAIVNSLGFPFEGLENFISNLKEARKFGFPIGVSLGLNKEVVNDNPHERYATLADKIYPHADYVEVNVSSPNTPGLIELQGKQLASIIDAIYKVMDNRGKRKPLFVKISPDLTMEQLDAILEVMFDRNVPGIVATNTTQNSELKTKYGFPDFPGGLSGDVLEYKEMVLTRIAHLRHQAITKGKELFISGCGGLTNVDDVLNAILAGANDVQVVSALRNVGPIFPGKTNKGLAIGIRQMGYDNLQQIVGLQNDRFTNLRW